jgi:ABC-type glycerol-3-phosphate transport system substrate-binding protein
MKTTTFQYIMIASFGIIGVVGIIYFAKSDPEQNTEVQGAAGNVVIWGTFQQNENIDKLFNDFNQKYQKSFSVTYVPHDPKTFDQDIVEALASGTGPDILLLPDNLILRHTDKIIPMAYTPQFGQREYLNTFIQASEIYLRTDGILAFPFAIDPMMMYWNRDLFTNASIVLPPAYWDEFIAITPKLTKKDKALKLTQSAIAFGEYDNVNNAKDVISLLFLQVGSQIVRLGSMGPEADIYADSVNSAYSKQSMVSALRYFMDFSNPQKTIYTWSRSRANSEEEFINGNLAVYFDYASKYQELKNKNPHLNFGVSEVPQLRDGKADITIGKMYGLVTMKASKNQQTAFTAIRLLLDNVQVAKFSSAYNLPPVRRDMLANRPTDAVQATLYDAALRSRVWLDPRPEDSNLMYQSMIDSVSSGRSSVDTAMNDAQTRLKVLLQPYQKK